MAKLCIRCQETKPLTDFSAYNAARSWGWCKECWQAKHRARYTLKVEVDDSPHLCQWCGESYTLTQRRPGMFCSRRCKDSSKNVERQAAINAAKPPRECLHCGVTIPPEKHARARFCSTDCSYKAHALQRKLRLRTGQDNKPGYLRLAICRRDGWKCGICGERVNPSLTHPHPMAASLDHVIPVCEGGLSEPANLRLVHLVCNLRRRHLGGNEQLALI